MTAIINNSILTDAAVVTVPPTIGNSTTSKYFLQLTDAVGASRVINFPTVPGVDGEVVDLEIVQSATGSRAATWGSRIAFGTDITAAVLTVTANKRDYIRFRYCRGLDRWCVTSFVKGF